MPQSSSCPRPADPCGAFRPVAFCRQNLLLLVLLTTVLGHGRALPAQAADVQLQLTPSTIQLAAGDTAKVVAVLRNNSGAALQHIQIQFETDAGLTVRGPSSIAQAVKPKNALAWPIEISQSTAGRSVGAVQFWATYTSAGAEGTGVAVATLQVQEFPPLDIGKLVTLKLESAVDELDEHHPARLYLVVTNGAAVPLTVTKINTYKPDFLTLTPEPLLDAVLQPQTSRAFPVKAEVTNQAAPGNHRVVLTVDLSWTDGGKPRTGAVATAQTLPVSILGQSELLKLMGVPSFLFLPGFLALAAFGVLWVRVAPKTKLPEPLSVEEKALLAVSLSFLAAFVYPWLTNGRNYLNGYGLRDVVSVWFGSIAFAVAVWIGVAGLLTLQVRLRKLKAERIAQAEAEAVRLRTPTKNDSPSQMLERMQANHVGLPPSQVLAKLGSAPQTRAFLVLPAGGSITDCWVAPFIELIRNGAGQPQWSREQLVQELGKDETTANPAALAKFLRQADASGWNAQWGTADVIVSPTPVPASSLQEVEQAPAFDFVRPKS